MAEKVVEVKTYRVSLWCEAEGCEEEMTSTGYELTSNPPMYPHKCRNGHTQIVHSIYPSVIYEEVRE